MSLRDWVQNWLHGDEPKPAAQQAPSADTYRAQAAAPKSAPAAAPKSGLQGWKPPANTPAPPQMRTAPPPAPAPKHLPAFGSPPEPWVPATPAQKATPPEMPDGIRSMLNENNWTLPDRSKKNEPGDMPDTAFVSLADLQQYDYKITNEEKTRIRDTYSTPGALYAGYHPPIGVEVDKNMPLMHMTPTQSAVLSADAYANLGADQQAAVDFNTLLVDSREKDLAQTWDLSPEDQAEHDARVEKLFGKGFGSETVAPNTVKLLDELNVVQLGQDLDEYLSLERAIDSKELGTFKFSDADVKTLNTLANAAEQKTQYKDIRSAANLQAVDSANIQAAQQKIKTALANPAAVSYDFNTLMMPTDTDAANVPLGFGETGTDQVFRDSLSALGSTNLAQWNIPADADPMSFILDNLKETGADEATQEKFLQYVANQAQLFGQYGNEEQKTMAALVNKRAGLGG